MVKSKISFRKGNLSQVKTLCYLAITCALAFVFAKPTSILLLILVLPSLLVWLGDHRPGRSSLLAVFLFGVAASCHPLGLLWHSNHTIEIAMVLASDIRTLSIAWASQAGGWLLTQTLPLIVEKRLDANVQRQIAQLHQQRLALVSEWHLPLDT